MQFITTDQRIAVENFELGVVYTVAFSSGDSFTGSCTCIGVDFVTFQRTAPEYIFCLTMTTAADIAGIDPLGDDIGKILTYTGSVPVSIKTDGTPLLDYLITGDTIQNGTPTPENPIIPKGCGELEAGQYKIPISSASTTTPVYLGEVETTRKIRKLVLSSSQNWKLQSINSHGIANFYITITNDFLNISSVISNYFTRQITAIADTTTEGMLVALSAETATMYIRVKSQTASTAQKFKNWLDGLSEEAAIWYVLATEETAVVNEPLMKIGDYADTLSYRQSGVNIPTTDGLNIFDIDTTVKPSEVYLKYFSPLF